MRAVIQWCRNSALISGIERRLEPSPTKWALVTSDKTMPDEIITAAVIQSLAADFPDWKLTNQKDGVYVGKDHTSSFSGKEYWIHEIPTYGPRLSNANKDIKVDFFMQSLGKTGSYYRYGLKSCKVNGILISEKCMRMIHDAYIKLKSEHDAVKQKAAQALAEQQRNEAAWDLAERLLGMKRNEFGALVPVVSAEHSCDCDVGELCEGCTA